MGSRGSYSLGGGFVSEAKTAGRIHGLFASHSHSAKPRTYRMQALERCPVFESPKTTTLRGAPGQRRGLMELAGLGFKASGFRDFVGFGFRV